MRILYKLKESEINSVNNRSESDEVSEKNNNLTPSYYITYNIMKKFDINRDGLLTINEFIDGCLDNEEIRKFLTPLSIFQI